MRKETSQWSKDVRKAMIDKDMTLKQLSENIGYCYTTISSVINGRYSNTSCQEITEKINLELGIKGMPERINTPSDEWCQCVKIELVKRKMSVSQLARKLDVSRDRLSLVINGRMMNEKIVDAINKLMDIKIPVISSGLN